MRPTRTQRAWRAWLELPEGIRPGVVGVILILVIAALLAVWPRSAHAADLVASNGQDSVRLTDKPCTSEAVLDRLPPQLRELMREARAFVRGEPYVACWIAAGDSAALLYEDGDQGLVPFTDFAPEKGSRALDGKML